MAQHAPHHAAGRHGHVAHHRVAQGFEGQEGRHRFEAHCLAGAGAQKRQAVQLLDGKAGHIGRDAAHFLARPRQCLRVTLQQINHPRNRVGRRVFAGQQHGQHIAGHGAVVDAAVLLVGGGDHGFEQVGRTHASRRVLRHARARLLHQIGDGPVQRRHVAVQPLVGRQFEVAPVGQHRQAASRHGRQDRIHMALDHVLARLQRIDLGAERQAGDNVHRIALQIAVEIDGVATAGGAVPAPLQALRHRHQRREIRLDGAGGHAGHHHAALVAPRAAFGQEQARDAAHFLGHDVAAERAPEAIGAVAQDGGDRFAVGHHQHQRAAEPGAHVRAIAAHPAFHIAVDAWQFQLKTVAEEGQGKRPGQVADLAQRLLDASRGRHGGVVEWRHGNSWWRETMT